jgi:hypothetical protein
VNGQNAAQPREKQIGANTYRVTPFGAWQATRIAAQLGSIVVKGVSTAAGLSTAMQAASGIDPDALETVLRAFADKSVVMQPEHKMAPRPLLGCFDQHFIGRLDEMIQWAQFAFEVNYGESIERGKVLFAGLLGLQLSQSPSTSETNGDSSESSPAEGTQ